MKLIEKIVIPAMIIIGFFILVFIGVKVLAINRALSDIQTFQSLLSEYDQIIIDNR